MQTFNNDGELVGEINSAITDTGDTFSQTQPITGAKWSRNASRSVTTKARFAR